MNYKYIFKAVAVSAVAAFFCVGCGGGGGGNPAGGGGGSKLTVTGLPNGQWSVYVFPAGTDISNAEKYLNAFTKAEAGNYGANNGNDSPLFRVEAGGGPSPDSFYTGSGNRTVAIVGVNGTYWATVNFSNGNATVPFSKFTLVEGTGGGGNPPDTGGGNPSIKKETFTDSRDNKSYKKVVIGTQTWMAENLNYNAAGSKCYENSPDSCARYGRLYDWNTALTACPVGWHLPIDAEWTVLTEFVGSNAGTKLKSPNYWFWESYLSYAGIVKGTDEYGFSALPGGSVESDGSFKSAGDIGIWWSATESKGTPEWSWYREMGYHSEGVSRASYDGGKNRLFSVRCLEGDEPAGSSYISKGNDINNYRVVQIGTQKWMAENLDYDVPGSKCWDNDSANCAKYGRLYDWTTAMKIDTMYNRQEWKGSDVKHQGICPDKWHIPSDAEWTVLTDYVGGESVAGKKLKSMNGWLLNGNGTDEYGFTALPGGDGIGGIVGTAGYWWSATEYSNVDAWYRSMDYGGETVGRNQYSKSLSLFSILGLYSVRCVAD
jgi:uncharacterized protein (TIGR02145 family)